MGGENRSKDDFYENTKKCEICHKYEGFFYCEKCDTLFCKYCVDNFKKLDKYSKGKQKIECPNCKEKTLLKELKIRETNCDRCYKLYKEGEIEKQEIKKAVYFCPPQCTGSDNYCKNCDNEDPKHCSYKCNYDNLCKKCVKEDSRGSKFCPDCGEELFYD
ncbi:MAG: hypothetical protein ACOCP8_00925 [archaeon]